MSEKQKIQRFNLDEGRIWEAIEGLSPFRTTYTLEEVCEKLNEQQATISALKEENEVLLKEWSERQQYFKKVEDEYHERVMNYQEEIKRLKCMNNQLERRLDYSIAYDMGECE